jgi:hypothetical protein
MEAGGGILLMKFSRLLYKLSILMIEPFRKNFLNKLGPGLKTNSTVSTLQNCQPPRALRPPKHCSCRSNVLCPLSRSPKCCQTKPTETAIKRTKWSTRKKSLKDQELEICSLR